jgi:hypothetical protein
MEATGDNYYQKNEETGKLNIYTTKAFYNGLAPEQKKVFTRYCLWSRNQDCWVSKGKAEHVGYLKQLLAGLGFENRKAVGARLPFAEQVRQEQERAEQRAERSEKRAENAQKRSEQFSERAWEMSKAIPMGQPIQIGHHSEQRDRRYRERIHNTMGRSVKEQEKVAYYKEKAASAAYTAKGEKYNNPLYLNKKIKEVSVKVRRLERYLQGKFTRGVPARAISEKEKEVYTGKLAEYTEQLEYFVIRMKQVNPDYQYEHKVKSGKSSTKKL